MARESPLNDPPDSVGSVRVQFGLERLEVVLVTISLEVAFLSRASGLRQHAAGGFGERESQ